LFFLLHVANPLCYFSGCLRAKIHRTSGEFPGEGRNFALPFRLLAAGFHSCAKPVENLVAFS
jgi:hypothetical protein